LAQKRYDAGYVSYLDVVEAERTELESERASAQLEAQRLNVAVALIKALGGGWKTPGGPPATDSQAKASDPVLGRRA
jgi:outer membrane protein TolC